MEIRVDIDKLRSGLEDHFGTAMMGGLPMAIGDLSNVEKASPQQLITIAEREGIDLRGFQAK